MLKFGVYAKFIYVFSTEFSAEHESQLSTGDTDPNGWSEMTLICLIDLYGFISSNPEFCSCHLLPPNLDTVASNAFVSSMSTWKYSLDIYT